MPNFKVWIDQDLCTGDGICEEITPALFSGHYDGLEQLPDGDFLPAFPFNDVELAAKARIEADFPTRRMIMGRTANLSRVAKAQMDVGRKRCEQHVKCHHGCPYGEIGRAHV